MVALFGFGATVHEELGREQFLALYFTGAVGASIVSHVASVLPLLSGGAARTAMRLGRCCPCTM